MPEPKKHEQDLLEVTNILDVPFQVKWGGQAFSIGAGQTKTYPRFLAEHFAKHMTDFFLLRLEKKESIAKGQSLLQSSQHRPKVVERILKVKQYYLESPDSQDPSLLNQVKDLNDGADEEFVDMGLVAEDPVLGALQDIDIDKAEPVRNEDAATSSSLDNPATELGKGKSDADLKKEAKELGIKLTGKETREEILAKIAEF